MMGWLSNIFRRINPQKCFDTVAKGIDNLAFTEEEKSEMNKEIIKANAEFVSTSLSENSIRSTTRRYIALTVVGLCVFLTLLAAAIFKIDPVYSNFLFKIVDSYSNAFLAVIAFYFGAGMLRTFKGKK